MHTCIDTSGYLGANCDDEMLDAIDLVLLDVKSGDPETYKKATGRDLAPTITFGDRIAARGGDTRIWIRFVLVPGLTDDPDNIRMVGETSAAGRTSSTALRFCLSISSAKTSGIRSAWSTSWRMRRPRHPQQRRTCATTSVRWVSKSTDPRTHRRTSGGLRLGSLPRGPRASA